MSKGVLYIATDAKFIAEATESARSLKLQMDIPTALITDQSTAPEVFDHHLSIESLQYGFGDKVMNIHRSPFEKTLFVDNDTYFVNQVGDVFGLLDEYPLAAALAPWRIAHPIPSIPDAFTEYNTGVIAFRDTPQVQSLFSNWRDAYQELLSETDEDQPAFRKALYETDIEHATLPSEYNCRFPHLGYIQRDVKILHGRHPDRQAVAEILNQYDSAVYTGTGGKIITTPEQTGSIREHSQGHLEVPYPKPSAWSRAQAFIDRLRAAVGRRGVRGTLRVAITRLRG